MSRPEEWETEGYITSLEDEVAALRAESERLRAVEAAARVLVDTEGPWHGTIARVRAVDALEAALDALAGGDAAL